MGHHSHRSYLYCVGGVGWGSGNLSILVYFYCLVLFLFKCLIKVFRVTIVTQVTYILTKGHRYTLGRPWSPLVSGKHIHLTKRLQLKMHYGSP